jgi:hypothetical protein
MVPFDEPPPAADRDSWVEAFESPVFSNLAWSATALLQISRRRVLYDFAGSGWNERLRRAVLDALLQACAMKAVFLRVVCVFLL